MHLRRTALLILAASIAGRNDRGDAAVYEGFQYGDSADILTTNGGMGFADLWQGRGALLGNGPNIADPQSVQLRSSSLGFTDGNGHALLTSGGSLLVTGEHGSTGLARTYDPAAIPNPAPPTLGEQTYISFLLRREGPAADPNDPVYGGSYPWGNNLYPRSAGIYFFSNDNGDAVPMFVGNLSSTDSDVLRLAGEDLDDNLNDFASPFGEGAPTYFVVFRIDHAAGDGGGETIHAYVNPLLTSEGLNSASLVANWEKDDDPLYLPGSWIGMVVNSASGNRPHSELAFDELRIGQTWADVTPIAIPEPSSTTLLCGACGLVAFGLRRFRRA